MDAPPRLLRLPEVLAKMGLSRSAFLHGVRTGELPQPIRIAARAVAWVESELDEFIAARIAERDRQIESKRKA